MVAKWRPKVLQNAPRGAFCNTFDLHLGIIGLEKQFVVFMRVAILHRFFCMNDWGLQIVSISHLVRVQTHDPAVLQQSLEVRLLIRPANKWPMLTGQLVWDRQSLVHCSKSKENDENIITCFKVFRIMHEFRIFGWSQRKFLMYIGPVKLTILT